MIYLGYILLDLWAFFIIYVACMGMIRARAENKLNALLWLLCLPFVTVGVLFNTLHNIFIMTILFAELPREWTVSVRLRRHINTDTKRGAVARFICIKLLSPFDHTGNHCD